MQPPYTPDDLKGENIRREMARRHLKSFVRYTLESYENAKHQLVLQGKLEQVEQFIRSKGTTGIGRLIITMPPRHGKSENVSIRFPAWFLGRNPDKRVILCSYAAELAEKFSKKCRDLVESKEYQNIFARTLTEKPVFVDEEKRRVQSWAIKDSLGEFVAAGVGGSITGMGADLLIIDDPIKDHEEANSEIIREKIFDWYTSTAYTRLQRPGGAVIIMMTRWHEDDLVGRLLEREPGKWEVLNLPFIAEDDVDVLGRRPGDILWPERYPAKDVEDIKTTVTPRDWISLFQQKPTSGSGEIFKKEWFRYSPFPHRDNISKGIQVWDTAMTEKEESDYSACVTAYVTRDGIFIADVFRARLGFPDLKQAMHNQYDHWNSVFPISRIYIEHKVSGVSVLQSLKKDSYLPVMPLEKESLVGKSKVQRANAASGYVQSGRVIFPVNGTFLTDFENELFGFPRGKHDDMVDAFVYAIITLRGGGRPPRKGLSDYRRVERDMELRNDNEITRDRHSQLTSGWGG